MASTTQAPADGDLYVAAVIAKVPYKEVRVTLREFKNTKFVDVRELYLADDGSWKPGKEGVTIPVDKTADFAQAAQQLRDNAREYLPKEASV